MNEPHTFKTLQEPRPQWVREFCGDKPVCACVRCSLRVIGTGLWWLQGCPAEDRGVA